MEKGQQVQIRIEDVTEDGQGVGKTEEGFTVFLKGGLPGDVLSVEIIKLKKSYAVARPLILMQPSRYRMNFYCPYEKQCGGCPFGKLQYPAQLKVKERHVTDALTRIGKLEEPQVNEIVGMQIPYAYRNKAVLKIQNAEDGGKPLVGFYAARTHSVIDCDSCRIQLPTVIAVADAVREFMHQDHITAFDAKTGKGLMKSVSVRTSFSSGEVMVTFEINGKGIANVEKLVSMVDDAIYDLPKATSGVEYSLESVYIEGKLLECIVGQRTITEKIGETLYEISPKSFFQVNPKQTEALYDKVFEYACLSDGDTVLDLYCGVGSIGLYLSGIMCDKIRLVGIEAVHDAILNANRNAVINGIVNARYLEGKAEEVLPGLIEKSKAEEAEVVSADDSASSEERATSTEVRLTKADVVILDPPRAGCDERLLKAACIAEPERIVYVSCNPATLARDLQVLQELGHEFVEATPVDMFPNTGHVETVVLLSKVHIAVDD